MHALFIIQPNKLLQAQTMFHNKRCSLYPHITVMPRFIDDSRNVLFIFGITDNKTIVLTVLTHPLEGIGRFQFVVFIFPIVVRNITGKPRLMFTGSGSYSPIGCSAFTRTYSQLLMSMAGLAAASSACKKKITIHFSHDETFLFFFAPVSSWFPGIPGYPLP